VSAGVSPQQEALDEVVACLGAAWPGRNGHAPDATERSADEPFRTLHESPAPVAHASVAGYAAPPLANALGATAHTA